MTLHEYPDVEQRSDEWFELRRGIVTASTIGGLLNVGPRDASVVSCPECNVESGPCVSLARKVPTPLKAPHAARVGHAEQLPPVISLSNGDVAWATMNTLAIERINGWSEETRMTADMWRGVEHEPIARDYYSQHHTPATEYGFMRRDEDGWSLGLSPDGIVGDEGIIEIKCPRIKSHVQTILSGTIPAQYVAQCQAALLVSGRAWLDFVSFHGGMPLKVIRVLPDPDWFAAIEVACRRFELAARALVDTYTTAVAGLPTTERVLEEEIRF